MPFGPRLKAIKYRGEAEKQGALVVAIYLPASNFLFKMDKQQRLRQAEQSNISQAITDYDARLQQAFKDAGITKALHNTQNQEPWQWVRTADGWTISRNHPPQRNSSDNS